MTDKPSEAAIREACRRAGYCEATAEEFVRRPTANRAVNLAASLIEKYEPDTLIDPYLKRARELLKGEFPDRASDIEQGDWDRWLATLAVIRALKEGMPK